MEISLLDTTESEREDEQEEGVPSDPFPFEIPHEAGIYIMQIVRVMTGGDEDGIRHLGG